MSNNQTTELEEPRTKCEAGEWSNITGFWSDCSNEATHTEYWFDEEAVEVKLCDKHSKEGQ